MTPMSLAQNKELESVFTKLAADSRERLLNNWRAELSELEKRAARETSPVLRAQLVRSASALNLRIRQLERAAQP